MQATIDSRILNPFAAIRLAEQKSERPGDQEAKFRVRGDAARSLRRYRPSAARTSQADQIRGRSLVVVTHEKPSFSAATATKAMFGAFGAIAMISEGDEIVRTNQVQDPSIYIAEEIAQALAQR